MRDNFDLQLKTIKNPFHLAGRYITKYISTTWNYYYILLRIYCCELQNEKKLEKSSALLDKI